jgi:glucosamine-6-phosphate deaminase
MGGTLRRLIDQGHQVSVAYQTSGSLAVPDEEALMAADLMTDLGHAGASGQKETDLADDVRRQLQTKPLFAHDSAGVRLFKAIIRRCEARAALRCSKLDSTGIRFLDLPFYENGRYRQFHPTSADLGAVVDLLDEVTPHQIFATGDLDDPASPTAICWELVRQAFDVIQSRQWAESCRLWLYRTPTRRWRSAELNMAVPLSPNELGMKIQAIYQHKSQRSQSPFADATHRESWQQAEASNCATARDYDSLGLAEYAAIEGFQRWIPSAADQS